MAITDMDRLVVGAAMPTARLELPAPAEFGSGYFTERREVGIMNLGSAGHVRLGDAVHCLGPMDFLYIGTGNPHVFFERCGTAAPCFYFLSCPAHRQLPVVRVGADEAQSEVIGDAATASRRRLNKVPGQCQGMPGCQTERRDKPASGRG